MTFKSFPPLGSPGHRKLSTVGWQLVGASRSVFQARMSVPHDDIVVTGLYKEVLRLRPDTSTHNLHTRARTTSPSARCPSANEERVARRPLLQTTGEAGIAGDDRSQLLPSQLSSTSPHPPARPPARARRSLHLLFPPARARTCTHAHARARPSAPLRLCPFPSPSPLPLPLPLALREGEKHREGEREGEYAAWA